MAFGQCEPGANEFIESHFHDCVYTVMDGVGFVLGVSSIFIWLLAQLPQFISNIKNQSAEALSVWFLAQWFAGDTLNLMGCLIQGQQLPTTTLLAMYFVLSDMVMLLQYIYYGALQARKKRLRKQTRKHQHQRSLQRASKVAAVKLLEPLLEHSPEEGDPLYTTPIHSIVLPHSDHHKPTTPPPSPPPLATPPPAAPPPPGLEAHPPQAPPPSPRAWLAPSLLTMLLLAGMALTQGPATGPGPGLGVGLGHVGYHDSSSIPLSYQHSSGTTGTAGATAFHSSRYTSRSAGHESGRRLLLSSDSHVVRSLSLEDSTQAGSVSVALRNPPDVDGSVWDDDDEDDEGDDVAPPRSSDPPPAPSGSDDEHWWNNMQLFRLFAGTVCGYVSCIMYLSSRVSQISKNMQRKSAEGLSALMFLMALAANLFTGSSILLRLKSWLAFGDQLPWILQAFGTVSLDLFIFYQTIKYRHPQPEHHHHHHHHHQHDEDAKAQASANLDELKSYSSLTSHPGS
eukprot:gene3376-13411_t